MSGQLEEGGFSVINSDQFCDHIRMADVMRNAYLWELQYGKVECAPEASGEWIVDQYQDTCVNEKAAEYYSQYHENIEDAMDLVSTTKEVGWFDRVAGMLIRPIAVIGALIWLI